MTDEKTPDPDDLLERLAALAREIERLVRGANADGHARAELDSRLTGAIAQLDQLAARTAAAEQTATKTSEHVRDLIAMLKKQAGANTPAAAVSWLLLGPVRPADGEGSGGGPDDAARMTVEQASEHLHQLVRWVSDVYLRYSDAELPSCWMWHPEAIEELTTLRGTHHAALNGQGAGWQKLAEFHERWRPGVVRRLRIYFDGDCDLTRHRWSIGDRRDRGIPAVPLAAHLGAVARTWVQELVTPAPDAVQLADADAYDSRQART